MARIAILLSLSLLLLPGAGHASVDLTQAEHLIITPAALVGPFEQLAQHRTSVAELPSCVVTLEEALVAGPTGRDDAETLRNYVRQLYELGSLKYLLLGGDSGVVPVRFVRSAWYPPGGFTDLETDLYFGALDGDWDADGDGIFGEGYTSYLDPGDAVDLAPELAVGRAPVNDLQQAQRFVDGLIQYDTLNPASHLASACFTAEVLYPADWTGGFPYLDGGNYAEYGAEILGGHPSAPMLTRLYENHAAFPGSAALTVASALDALQDGSHGLYYFIGEGGVDRISVGDGVITIADLDALTNAPSYHFTLAFSSESASFADDAILEHMVLSPSGGSAGALGFTEVSFLTRTDGYYERLLEILASGSGVLIGDAMRETLNYYSITLNHESFERWLNYTWCLLGDPGMPFRTELNPVPVVETTTGSFKSRFRGQ